VHFVNRESWTCETVFSLSQLTDIDYIIEN